MFYFFTGDGVDYNSKWARFMIRLYTFPVLECFHTDHETVCNIQLDAYVSFFQNIIWFYNLEVTFNNNKI